MLKAFYLEPNHSTLTLEQKEEKEEKEKGKRYLYLLITKCIVHFCPLGLARLTLYTFSSCKMKIPNQIVLSRKEIQPPKQTL